MSGQQRRNSTPLELLQEWSQQLHQNEAQLQRKVKSTLRRQASRKNRRPALEGLFPASPEASLAPAAAPGSPQQPSDGENVGGQQAAPGKASPKGGLATSPTLNMDSPLQRAPTFGADTSPPQAPRSWASPKGNLFAVLLNEEDGEAELPSLQHHRLPTSPARAPGSAAAPEAVGLASVRSPATSPQRPSPVQQLQQQRTPPASPGLLRRQAVAGSPSRLASPAAAQRTPPGSAPHSQHQSPAPSPSRLPSAAGAHHLAAMQQQSPDRCAPWQSPRASPSRLLASPSGLRLQQLQRQGSPAKPLDAAPQEQGTASRPTAPNPLAKLVLEASPVRLAPMQLSPPAAGDFRIKALSAAARSERSRVMFGGPAAMMDTVEVDLGAETMRERGVGGSEGSEEEFYSAAPSRTASQAAFASAQGSPSAPNNTVLQRLEGAAAGLAMAAAGQGAAGTAGPSNAEEDDYDDLDALLLGKPPSPPKPRHVAEASPSAGPAHTAGRAAAAAAQQGEEEAAEERGQQRGAAAALAAEEQLQGRSLMNPANLFGLFASRGGSPAKVEGPGSAAGSPLRQRLLAAPATLLSALGWGSAKPAEEVPAAGEASDGYEDDNDNEASAAQPSLPSNPFDMLAADEGQEEVQSASVQPSPQPSPQRSLQRPAPLVLPLGGDAGLTMVAGASPAARPRRRPGLQSGKVDASRASVASSTGGGTEADGGLWEGGASFCSPTRVKASQDNPLYEPFGSSIAPGVDPPAGAGQQGGGLPATHLLGAVRLGSPAQLSPSRRPQLSPSRRAQASPVVGGGWGQEEEGEAPGSAGSFAAMRRDSPLDPVVEQEDEGLSSPDVKPRARSRAPLGGAPTESITFAALEEQAEAWAQAQKPNWSTLQLPPAISAEEEAELSADQGQAADNLGGSGMSQPMLSAQEASLWQRGMENNKAAAWAAQAWEPESATASEAAAAERALGPLAEALSMHSKQEPEQGWVGPAAASLEQRGSPFDVPPSTADPRSRGRGEGFGLQVAAAAAAAAAEESSPEKGSDEAVEEAYTMPLRFSLKKHRRRSTDRPQQQQLAQPLGALGQAPGNSSGGGRGLPWQQGAALGPPPSRSPGCSHSRHPFAHSDGPSPLSVGSRAGLATMAAAEPEAGLAEGRSISLDFQQTASFGPAGEQSTPPAPAATPAFTFGEASQQGASAALPAAAGLGAAAAASPGRRSPSRRAQGPRLELPEKASPARQQHQWGQQRRAASPPFSPTPQPAATEAAPARSPAAAFRRGLQPLEVPVDETATSVNLPSSRAQPQQPSPSRAAAAARSPSPGPSQAARLRSPAGGRTAPASPLGPGSVQGSPAVGRSKTRPAGKRYSPESEQYKERLKHQGEVISSLYLRRQRSGHHEQLQRASASMAGQQAQQGAAKLQQPESLRGSASFHTAQPPPGVRDSASFHTAQATPPRHLRQQQLQQQEAGASPFRMSPSPVGAGMVAGAALASSAAAAGSPSPTSRRRPPALNVPRDDSLAGSRGAGASAEAMSLRYSTPHASMLSQDFSAAQQGAPTPGGMTPLTAINHLRANLEHGPAWEGQQQQMQSILSRLESRVRETRTRAKSEAERRALLEKQVYDLEHKVKSLAEEADQASTLKWELTGARQELEALREENLKLQQEREEWEAQLAAERERLQVQLAGAAQLRPARQARSELPVHPYPLPIPTAAPAAAPIATAPAPLVMPDPLLQLEPEGDGVIEDLRFVPPSPQQPPPGTLPFSEPPPAYVRPEFVEAPGPRFPTPSAPRAASSLMQVNGFTRGDPAHERLPPRGHSNPAVPAAGAPVPAPLQAARPTSGIAAAAPMGGSLDPEPLRCPGLWKPSLQQQLAPLQQDYGGGRLSNGSDYSDPATAPWHSMAQAQQSAWDQTQPQQPPSVRGPPARVRQQAAAARGGWEAPLSARYPGEPNQFSARQDQPPRGSTWEPSSTPRGRDLHNLLRVAGDSSMFRPLYTGAQELKHPPHRVYETM